MADEHEPPLTVAEAAHWLKVSPSTIYAMCAAGKLEHCRIGIGRGTIRIKKSALLALSEQGPEPRWLTAASEKMRRHLGIDDEPDERPRKGKPEGRRGEE
jgi:excisionase family DNA binding protein